jgi:FkbM family methyltransferase
MNKTIQYKGKTIEFKNLLTSGHNIDRFIINNNLYKRPDHNFDFLLSLLKEGDVVYDIGAYIGTFSIPFALSGMKVYAFEGFPDNFDRLTVNCEPYSNIENHLVAVSNENNTVVTKFNDCTAQDAVEREINYRIFDEYLSETKIEKPNLVKVDIEGMETLALFGMTNLIENVRPIWQIGYHIGLEVKYDNFAGFVSVENGGFNFNRFKELGYDIYNENNVKVDSFTTWGEYICVPK